MELWCDCVLFPLNCVLYGQNIHSAWLLSDRYHPTTLPLSLETKTKDQLSRERATVSHCSSHEARVWCVHICHIFASSNLDLKPKMQKKTKNKKPGWSSVASQDCIRSKDEFQHRNRREHFYHSEHRHNYKDER